MFLLPSAIGAIQQDPIRRIFKQASLDLQFAEKKSLVDATTGASLVTFTRASSGTFVGSDGVLQTAVTNLLLRSEEFDNAAWTKDSASITTNTTTAPDGTITADTYSGTSTSGVRQSVTLTSGTVYTISFYVKSAGLGNNGFRLVIDGTQSSSNFTATSDWQRFTFTATSANTGLRTCGIIRNSLNAAIDVFIWGAQLVQSSTVGEYIPTTSTINSAPRFDHNPVTGESLGLLVEEQRTNSIRNNTGVGAVAGTPGTLPTNWVQSALGAGLTSQVVGTGTQSGIAYIDIRVSGTAGDTAGWSVHFDASTAIAASSGQSWTGSVYLAIVGGSTSGTSSQYVRVIERNLVGGYVTESNILWSAAGSVFSPASRISVTRASMGATTGFVQEGVYFNSVNGAAIDITLRIGLPQLEQGAFATSVIPTSTAAVTRSADVASITGSAFSSWYRQSEGTVFADVTARPDGLVCNFDDGSFNNRKPQIAIGAGASCDAAYVTTGSTVASFLQGSTSNQRNLIATAYATDNYGFTSNGATPVQDSLGALPSTVTTLRFGRFHNGIVPLYGTIRRLCYWPARLPNSTLQTLTQ